MTTPEWFAEAYRRIELSGNIVTLAALRSVVDDARFSLGAKAFDMLSDARKFVLTDIQWSCHCNESLLEDIKSLKQLIMQAQYQKASGNSIYAITLFLEASQKLEATAWYSSVEKERGMRAVAMLAAGIWCSPHGNGSDILKP
jgi:hypothetical protein